MPEPKAQLATTDTGEKTSAVATVGNQPLDLVHLTLNQLNFIGKTMAASGMFQDSKDSNQALVKILAGQEIGITPFQAMTNINIIQGKATLGANLYAAKVKSHPKYDYRSKLDSESCTITIFEKIGLNNREEIGEFTYTMEDAKRQGLSAKDNWKKFPMNMLFARAISNAVRLFAPDVFNGSLVYTPEEMGADVTEQGDAIETTVVELATPEAVKEFFKDEGADVTEEPEDAPKEATQKKARALMKELGYTGAAAQARITALLGKDKPVPTTETEFKQLLEALEAEKEATEEIA